MKSKVFSWRNGFKLNAYKVKDEINDMEDNGYCVENVVWMGDNSCLIFYTEKKEEENTNKNE